MNRFYIFTVLLLLAVSFSAPSCAEGEVQSQDSTASDSAAIAEDILSNKGVKDKAVLIDPVVLKEVRPNVGDWGTEEMCMRIREILDAREGGYVDVAAEGNQNGVRKPKPEYILEAREGHIVPRFEEFHLMIFSAEEEVCRGKYQEWAVALTNCVPGTMQGLHYEERANGYYSSIQEYVLYDNPATDGRFRLGLGKSGNAWVVELTFGK